MAFKKWWRILEGPTIFWSMVTCQFYLGWKIVLHEKLISHILLMKTQETLIFTNSTCSPEKKKFHVILILSFIGFIIGSSFLTNKCHDTFHVARSILLERWRDVATYNWVIKVKRATISSLLCTFSSFNIDLIF